MRGESGEDDENCECERKREEGGKNVSLQKIAIFFRFFGVEKELGINGQYSYYYCSPSYPIVVLFHSLFMILHFLPPPNTISLHFSSLSLSP